MVAATLSAVAEAAKDCRVLIWNVRNLCETSGWFWICVGMVIVILTVWSGGPFANPIGQMTEVDRRSSSIMRRYPDQDSAWNLIANGVIFGHEVVHPVSVKARPSIERDDSLRCSDGIFLCVTCEQIVWK